MTLSINLPADAESKLREQAAAAGKDISSFVQEAIEEKLALSNHLPSNPPSPGSIEQLAKFNEWIASHSSQKHVANDSRDAIYGDERDE